MKTLLIIIICIILFSLTIYWYYEGFKQVQINIKTEGGETAAYQEIVGDYKQSGTVMDKVYYLLKNENIETYKGFGIYYDNPQKVEKSKLRSEAGCIIEPKDTSRIYQITETIEFKTLPNEDYLITEFPYKGKLSIIFGIMKVYPALNEYVRENGFEEESYVIEIYDIPNKKIVYRKLLINKN